MSTTPHPERAGLAWLIPAVAVVGSLILGLVLWQCSDAQAGSTVATADQGLVVFREAGCGSCHGQTGEGGSGPALGGLGPEQVIRQTRAPYGAMPMFTVAELGDDDLAAIVEFVSDLSPVDHRARHAVGPGGVDPRDDLAAHHWLGLMAIQSGAVDEAAHQIGHIDDDITGGHLEAMRHILTLLETDVAEAEQTMLEMVAGYLPDAADLDRLDARLALEAIALGDTDEAGRHLGALRTGALGDAGQQAIEALEVGNAAVAGELLTAALDEP